MVSSALALLEIDPSKIKFDTFEQIMLRTNLLNSIQGRNFELRSLAISEKGKISDFENISSIILIVVALIIGVIFLVLLVVALLSYYQ